MKTNRAWLPVQTEPLDRSPESRVVLVPLWLPKPDYQFAHGFDLYICPGSFRAFYDVQRNVQVGAAY